MKLEDLEYVTLKHLIIKQYLLETEEKEFRILRETNNLLGYMERVGFEDKWIISNVEKLKNHLLDYPNTELLEYVDDNRQSLFLLWKDVLE